MTTQHHERMSSVDTAWLRMDGPGNSMMIVGVSATATPIDPRAFRRMLCRLVVDQRSFGLIVQRRHLRVTLVLAQVAERGIAGNVPCLRLHIKDNIGKFIHGLVQCR